MKSNYWLFLFLSITAFADVPSKNWTFVWKNAQQLKNFDCNRFSDELENGMVAEVRKMKDVYQHWFLICGATESDLTTFNINLELFLSAKNQAGIQEINYFLQSHQNEVIQGIPFNPLKVQKFKVQAKIQADRVSPVGGSHLEAVGSAERTYFTEDYSEFSNALTQAKNSLKGAGIQEALSYIRNHYGEATQMDFENDFLPKASSVVEKFSLFFLLEDGTPQKAIPTHQFRRDCKTPTQATCL